MASTYPVSTNPQSLSHLRVVIDRLRKQIEDTSTTIGDGTVVLTSTASVDLSAGEVVYAPSAGSLAKAKADAVTTSKIIGVATANVLTGQLASVQSAGIITVSTWSLTANTIYYLDPSTAGAITATAPTIVGQVVIPVGIAVSETTMKLLLTPLVLL